MSLTPRRPIADRECMSRALLLFLFFSALTTQACACNDTPPAPQCRADADCDGGTCVAGRCQARVAMDSCPTCNGVCCNQGQRCGYGMCILDLGPCTTSNDCPGDSYCDMDMRCTPYGIPPGVNNDPRCSRLVEIGEFAPQLQCQWGTGVGAKPPVAMPTFTQTRSVPVVADFNFDDDPDVIAPSIVITTYPPGQENIDDGGIIRVIDGRTCAEQFAITEERVIYSSQNALADIDLDGRPEIVAMSLHEDGEHGGIVVFRFNAVSRRFERLWYGHTCPDGARHRPVPPRIRFPINPVLNNGPSVHDFNDDGRPEIVFDTYVYQNDGCVLNPGAPYIGHALGDFPVIADVENDGEPELVRGDGVYHVVGTGFQLESYFTPDVTDPLHAAEARRRGYVAVADLVDTACPSPDAFGCAEIAVVSTTDPDPVGAPTPPADPCSAVGRLRVMTLQGRVVFGPFDLPAGNPETCTTIDGMTQTRSGGRGGPPTIADFDGDGRREIAIAGAGRYTVFDLDCDIDAEDGPGCDRTPSADNPLLRGVLWSRLVQDNSSNFTGSSVYDFEADGKAEVVYRDECFLRIFAGPTGQVLYSQSGSSVTGHEYPVVADVDGDFNTEIVVALENLTSGVTCPASDPSFPSSTFENASGIAVMRDVMDRWVPSRHIWNQHAYSVTNINENGTVPRTSMWMRNHSIGTLNNYRQNTQGGTQIQGLADLTVKLAMVADLCNPTTSQIMLSANVCNRGTNPVADGAAVVFYDGNPDMAAPVACQTTLPELLEVGECTDVACTWTVPPTPSGESPTSDVTVVVDPMGLVVECREGNNRGVIPGVLCLNIM